MTTTFKNEDLKILPAGTRCSNCFKEINYGVLQGELSVGFVFFCKECHLKKLGIKN